MGIFFGISFLCKINEKSILCQNLFCPLSTKVKTNISKGSIYTRCSFQHHNVHISWFHPILCLFTQGNGYRVKVFPLLWSQDQRSQKFQWGHQCNSCNILFFSWKQWRNTRQRKILRPRRTLNITSEKIDSQNGIHSVLKVKGTLDNSDQNNRIREFVIGLCQRVTLCQFARELQSFGFLTPMCAKYNTWGTQTKGLFYSLDKSLPIRYGKIL